MSPKWGVIHWEIVAGRTTNGNRYAQFLTNLFKHIMFQEKNMIVVQDNASIHKHDDVSTNFWRFSVFFIHYLCFLLIFLCFFVFFRVFVMFFCVFFSGQIRFRCCSSSA
jgi:hypothetical protein